uniref:Uncharacterized protein n=1 Tax=Magallana gigas TaxID=29159 RepID=A0A8W8MKD6_MAGGI
MGILHKINNKHVWASGRMLVRNRDWCGSRTVAKKGLWKTFLAIYSFITVQYRNPMDMTPIILGTCWLSRTTTTILEGCHLLDRMEKCMVKARYLEGPNKSSELAPVYCLLASGKRLLTTKKTQSGAGIHLPAPSRPCCHMTKLL